jgi:hypothetical protein
VTAVRRFVFPLFAVCIALAVGIALGSGPLRGTAAEGGEAGADDAALAEEVRSLEDSQAFSEAVAEASAPGWVDGVLQAVPVTVVALPGVPADQVERAKQAVADAGGVVAVSLDVSADYVDPAKKTYVETVAETSMRSAESIAEAAAGGETYEQIAALVARAYVGNEQGATLDDEANKIASELTGAKLVTVAEPPIRRGTLTVVLAPGSHGQGAEMDARNTIVGDLVTALATQGKGVVVVTPSSGTEPGGVVDALESDPATKELKVSTLNVDEGATAGAALVLALRAAVDGKAGQYGVLPDGEVALPPGL